MTIYLWASALLAWTLFVSKIIVASAMSVTESNNKSVKVIVASNLVKALFWLVFSVTGFYFIIQGV